MVTICWNNLHGLSVNQFQHIIKRNCDVDTLRHPPQHCRFTNAAFQIRNHLGSFYRQGCLITQGIQKRDISSRIGFT